MKTNTVETIIDDFRSGQNIFRRPSVELLVREIERLRTQLKSKEIVIEAKQQTINKLAKKMLISSEKLLAQGGDITLEEYIKYLELKEQACVNKNLIEPGWEIGWL